MNKTQAMAALRTLYGKAALFRYDLKAPTADEREQIRAALVPAIAERTALREAADARRRELLADPVYRELVARHEAANKAVEKMQGRANHYRVTVGRDTGMFFRITAQADNWAAAIEKARGNGVAS